MAQGLRVRDAAGTIILDTSDRTMTFLGSVTATGPGSGSQTVNSALFAEGDPFVFPQGNAFEGVPVVTATRLSSTSVRIDWTFWATATSANTVRIMYGVG